MPKAEFATTSAAAFTATAPTAIWRVPHFEKMLYDNGQLISVYARAYALTERADFRRAAVEAIDFVLREMTDADGGFYAAIDAETDAEEGRYYVWQRSEIEGALTPDEYELWGGVYGIAGEPNFEGRYIPLLAKSLAEVAAAQARRSEAARIARTGPRQAAGRARQAATAADRYEDSGRLERPDDPRPGRRGSHLQGGRLHAGGHSVGRLRAGQDAR